MTITKQLLTVRQFAERHRAFPEGGLRYMIFHADKNGLDKAIHRVGRKVLIDEDLFFAWVNQQNQQSVGQRGRHVTR